MELNRSQQPATTDLSQASFDEHFHQIELLKPEAVPLKNGIPVYSINAGTQEIVKIELVFRAGSWYQQKHLQASLTASMMMEGTKEMTSAEIAEKIDFHGAYLHCESERDFSVISLFSLKKHFANTLPIVRQIITEAAFPEKEFEITKRKKKQSFLVNNQKVMNVARMHFNQMIFSATHPYGQLVQEKDYDQISRQDITDFYKKNYLNAPFRIIVSGKIDDQIIATIEQELGDLMVRSNLEAKEKVSEAIHQVGKQNIICGNGHQAAIRIGRLMFTRKHPDYFPMMVTNTILGGYFGSRLMSNIREEKGLTYGIGSALASFRHEGVFFVATEVNASQKQLAIDEIMAEIDRMGTTQPTEDELFLVKNYILGQFLRSLDGPFALAERHRILSDFELDIQYYRNFLNTVRNIKAEEIQALAAKYLKETDLSILVAGK